MAVLPTDQAIARFDANESLINNWVNSTGTYTPNSGLANVETIPSFMARQSFNLSLIGATNNRGAWTASTVYNLSDIVSNSGTWYQCVVANTSSSSFTTDMPLYWRIAQGITPAQMQTSYGASVVGFSLPSTGAVTRLLSDKLKDVVYVNDFGLSSSATATANKAAFVAAIASLTRPSRLVVAQGFYNIAPDINLGGNVVGIEGAGKYATYFSCAAGGALFSESDTTSVDSFNYCNFGIDGAGVLSEGIRTLKTNHSRFENLLITNTTSSGLHIGGYSDDIIGCDIFSNGGNGIYLEGTLNNVNVFRNKIYANGATGVLVASSDNTAGLSINIMFNDIEQNAQAGIIAFNTKALNIFGNYFERNAANGYTYSSPESILIRADIHLLASNAIAIDRSTSYSNKCATVMGNHQTAIGVGTSQPNLDGFIFTSYANNLRVENNQLYDTTKVNGLVAIYMNNVYSAIDTQCKISGNSTNAINMIGTYNAGQQVFDSSHLLQISPSVLPSNYADSNYFDWGILGGSTGILSKTSNHWRNTDTWQMTDGDAIQGFAIDLTVFQELRGQWIWFGIWSNDQGSNTNAKLYCGGTSNRSSTPAGGTAAWQMNSVLYYVPTSATTLYCAVQKVGTGSPLLINSPVVAIVGNPYSSFTPTPITYLKGAAPTTGTWNVGDRVKNITPTVGQPKAWVCTVAGTPGTWVSEGNL